MKTRSDFETDVICIVSAIVLISIIILFTTTSMNVNAQNESWTNSFNIEDCNFSTIGTNPYFILQPGYQLVFAGIEDNEPLIVTVTVSNETKVVGEGIVTRAVEERTVDSKTGALKELTKDYFAICEQTNSVYYFGEDVNNYEAC